MKLPTLNMAGWSILDYELALDGVSQINDAALCIQNQPRAYNSDLQDCHPGAGLIAAVGEGWCSTVLTAIIEALETKRFCDPMDEDRRLRLLLVYWSSSGPAGEPLSSVMGMMEKWRAPLAA